MTNAEKYLKDGVDVEEFVKELHCFWWLNEYDICEGIRKFLSTEAKKKKPTLTEDERVILEFIKNFDYIGRDKKGLYYKLQDEDIKEKTAVIYNLTTNLFQFIKERRRI